MEKLLTHPDLRQRFSENARKYVVDNFDQGYVWEELLKEYRRLVEEERDLTARAQRRKGRKGL
jgi:glycosyltransferase involved in cell wall biosynthesis